MALIAYGKNFVELFNQIIRYSIRNNSIEKDLDAPYVIGEYNCTIKQKK